MVSFRDRLDAIADDDAAGLASFAAEYTLTKCRHQIGERRDDGVYGDYLDRLQMCGHSIYLAVQADELDRDAGIVAFLPLAEARARRLAPKSLLDDCEGEAALAVTRLFSKLPSGIEKFVAFATTVIDAAIMDELRRERRAQRHHADAANGRERLDVGLMIDTKGDHGFAAVDTAEALDAIASDDLDRAIMLMRATGDNDREIAAAIGLTTSAVSLRRRKMAARWDERLRTVAEDSIDDRIITGGKSDRAVAAQCGISVASLEARRRGLETRHDRRAEQLSQLLA